VLERVKNLFRNLAIYGLGDVATSVVSLLLLPVYTHYLTPSDYGVIAMLLTIEAIAKVAFRWGVDTAFMRLYYDCVDHAARQRLASTIFFFLVVANGSLLAGGLMSADWLSARLFGASDRALLISLVIANTFIAGFFFIPLQVLRIGERSGQFIGLVFARSAGTLVMRLVLVIGAGMGVLGVVLADIVVTLVFTPIVGIWFAPLLRPIFSRAVIRDALGFGLPRIPHSIANQAISLADRYFLNAHGTLRDVGLYSIGASFGLAPKLFLSAFEAAWTPFFLGAMRERDAKHIYRVVSTYVLAVPALLVAALSAMAPDLVRLTTTRDFHEAAAVTPWIALGVMFQGVYLVGSIGLVITKRTMLYPIATGTAAAVSLVGYALLIPRYGLVGAAWANALAYGTLAAVTVAISLRLYPIRYEWSRLARIAAAGIVGYMAAQSTVPSSVAPLAGLVMRGIVTTATYVGILFLTGFFHAGEIRMLKEIRSRTLQPGKARLPDPDQSQVEMAGEIVSAPPEPNLDDIELDPIDRARQGVKGDSRAQRR
jgi:O-antigen/teichoic acid export membrane protein